MLNALSIDVEDWFHILGLRNEIPISDWHKMESRVERNTRRILNILDVCNETKATFFVLGWVAEHFPNLIMEIQERGHEIASHGYSHRLVYQLTPEQFREDVQRAKSITEDVIGQRVIGYRVPGFSIQNGNLWALDVIKESGFVYDSSIFPAYRGHGGFNDAPIYPYQDSSGLWEFPISVVQYWGMNIPFAGGGYLRFLPYSVIKKAINKINSQGQSVILYLHPRDLDIHQPRIELSPYRRFKCYVNLHTAKNKLEALLKDFNFAPVREVLGLR